MVTHSIGNGYRRRVALARAWGILPREVTDRDVLASYLIEKGLLGVMSNDLRISFRWMEGMWDQIELWQQLGMVDLYRVDNNKTLVRANSKLIEAGEGQRK